MSVEAGGGHLAPAPVGGALALGGTGDAAGMTGDASVGALGDDGSGLPPLIASPPCGSRSPVGAVR